MASTTSAGPVLHTTGDGRQIPIPPHEEFYRQLITRNQGIITDEEQRRLRNAPILIAGCGSIGGAVIEPLIRIGAEHLILVEPGEYDLPNMNRQSVRLQDIGRNKADVHRDRMRDINPYATISVDTHGITEENVEGLVKGAALIMDGVDVTTKPPLKAKFRLHQEAKRFRVPVIAGYDIAGLQLLIIYDYRNPAQPLLNNRVRAEEIDTIEPMKFLRRVIPIAAMPYEIVGEMRQQMRGEREGFPQIVYTANLFGVLALRAALNVLAGKPTRGRVMVDTHKVLRPLPDRLRLGVSRWIGLAGLANDFYLGQGRKGTAQKQRPALEKR